MLLDILHLAQLEHRERLRRFNVRAARGDFVQYTECESNTGGWPHATEHLRHVAHVIRSVLSTTGQLA